MHVIISCRLCCMIRQKLHWLQGCVLYLHAAIRSSLPHMKEVLCSARVGQHWLKLWKRGNVPVGAFSRVSARTLLWGKGNEKSSWLYIKLIFWPFQTEHWSPAAAAAAAGGIHVSDSHEGECRWWLNRRFIYSCLMRRCWGSSLCLFVDSLCFQLVVTRCRCACITWAEPRSLMCTPTMLSNGNATAAAGTHCRQTERPRASFHLLIL